MAEKTAAQTKTSAPQKAPAPSLTRHGESLNTYIPFDDLWIKSELERISDEDKRSISELTVIALRNFIDDHKKKAAKK